VLKNSRASADHPQSASPRSLPPDAWGTALLLIGAAGFALRFIGLAWGLPYEMHPDEPVILATVERMSWGSLNPGFFIYPGFFMYQVFLLSRVVFGMGGEHADLIYAARVLTAMYGWLTIGFVYLLGTRLGGRRLGTIAAGLVALMGALTLHAHYAVTDTPSTALATATVWLSVRAWQRRSYGELAAAAALAGLAVSTKYSVVPVCLVPWLGFMALAARARTPLVKRVSGTALLAGIAILAFLVTSPYTLLDYQGFRQDMGIELRLQAEARPGQHVDPLENPSITDRGLVGNAVAAHADMGSGALVLAAGALVFLLATTPGVMRSLSRSEGDELPASVSGFDRDHADSHESQRHRFPLDRVASLMVVAWIVLYYGFMAPSAIAGQRYMLPIYPAMMLLAAVPIAGAMRAGERDHPRRAHVFVAGMILIAAAPSFGDASSARLLAQRDTRLVARDWIIENLPPGSRLALESYAPPFHTGDGFPMSQPFSLTDHPLETYCGDGVEYLLLSSLNAEHYFADDAERFADERAWYERLDSRTRVVARIDGIGDLDLHHPTIEVRRLFCGSG
jgi:4-amino-4-deoxy-L-arabinose transferase-like glycosyltransferase